ncbi:MULTISPECIES: transglycosylase SLT domain-containing protein [unclassified Novosphingobium]|nr:MULTISPECIES: transglycosylase SLT domain-containing protein [unclassified Novosphingobium]
MAIASSALALLLTTCSPSVAPQTMNAIVMAESGGDPLRIGVNSGAALVRQPANMAEAIATARGLVAKGANFDAGLAQINSANFARLGLTPETVFEPCVNLRAAASVLAENYQRARKDGIARPLDAAISEYNSGNRNRGITNGYVGRVYAAVGAPAPQHWNAEGVGRLLLSAFGGRVTDTVRPMNAAYGAERSFHKFGQAVDFVPAGGVRAIDKTSIRRVMAANGIEILELLGPGDPGHDDHWHVAFARGVGGLSPERMAAAKVRARSEGRGAEVTVSQSEAVAIADEAEPPAWDVFAHHAWMARAADTRGGS